MIKDIQKRIKEEERRESLFVVQDNEVALIHTRSKIKLLKEWLAREKEILIKIQSSIDIEKEWLKNDRCKDKVVVKNKINWLESWKKELEK
jgi:hypothetical protein